MTNKSKKATNDEDTVPFPCDAEARTGEPLSPDSLHMLCSVKFAPIWT